MFRVANHEYDVALAGLKIFEKLGEDMVCWGVKILGKGQAGTDAISSWNPAVLASVLLETRPGQMSHWYEIAGTTIEWTEPEEDPQALFEVYESSALYDCKWQFVSVPGNHHVRLILVHRAFG